MASGMVIANNVSALNTTRQLSLNNSNLRTSLERLSSGFRINSGKDAPADLIISEQLRAQNTGLKRAVRNTFEASNVLSIAEGALNEMNAILKKMRELALHAANDGITSPGQVAADQAEMDSGIQTIDRIAQTTKYAEDLILNGKRAITFDRQTKEGDQALLDLGFTRIDQVFKQKNVREVLSYRGGVRTGDASDMVSQATKGFFESGMTDGSSFEINAPDNTLKTDQRFVITGKNGSREFSFNAGTEMSAITAAINNVKDSLGVEATNVLAADGFARTTSTAGMAEGVSGTAGNDVPENTNSPLGLVEQQTLVFNSSATRRVSFITWDAKEPILGKHTDGQGNMYLEMDEDAAGTITLNIYKQGRDPLTNTFNENDLVASGSGVAGVISLTERNDSGLTSDITVTSPGGAATTDVTLGTAAFGWSQAGKDARLRFYGPPTNGVNLDVEFVANSGVTPSVGGAAGNNISIELIDPGTLNSTDTTVSVSGDAEAGYNIAVTLATDAEGNITTTDTQLIAAFGASTEASALVTIADRSGSPAGELVEARAKTYLTGGYDAGRNMDVDGTMSELENIAMTGLELGVNTDAEGKLYFDVDNAGGNIFVYRDKDLTAESLVAAYEGAAALNATAGDNTYFLTERNDSGLNLALRESTATVPATSGIETGTSTITLEQTVRLSATEHGDQNFVRVQALEGNMWDAYDPDAVDADVRGYVNMDSSESFITKESRGSGATLEINGLEVFTDGLSANAATPDFNGLLSFREGDVGFTTVARVGQNKGYVTTAAGQMSNATNMAVNAGLDNEETITNFANGMQFQLGEGDGDQERTFFGIQAMNISNLGKVEFRADFNGDGTTTDRILSMSDMLGGGFASLAVAPTRTLEIIDQAIDDVAGLRARLGAFQANLLQTNENNLNVAIENITKTESAIRDADMAQETTDFTKNQIMTQAATSMLAQANAAQQQVLQLLG